MLKKRSGIHEESIRELRMANGRIEVGEPLSGFRGVLTGVPVSLGGGAQQIARAGDGGE